MDALIELQYLPSIRFFSKFLLYERLVIDDTETFKKQSYRNRCHILGANGLLPLIVPVHQSRRQLPVREIKIDHHTDWQRMHLQSIRSAYGKTPYFEHYYDKLIPYYEKGRFELLFDFNLELLKLLMQLTRIDQTKLQILSEKTGLEPGAYADLCSSIHPKEKYNKPDADFKAQPYIQAFSDRYGFVENLSVIDLLFNEGPGSGEVLRGSVPIGS